MIRQIASGAALAALLASGALAFQAMPASAPASVATTSPLPDTQALFESYVRTDKTPGIVGAFGAGDLPTVFVSAGRIADEATAPAAGPDSLWRVYSMTKPITALAAMMLIEQGKIGLDQPVSDFIPAFKTMRVQISPDSLASKPAASPITIRQLLTHTAGLGYTIITRGPLLDAYEKAGITPFTADAKSEAKMRLTRPKTLEDFANTVATLPLIAEPGTKWSYSIGLDVMGRVIEVASGMPFDRFLQTRIFTPLGMTSTYFTVPGSEAKRLATGYVWVGDGRVPLDRGASSVFLQPPSFPYGGAGLVSSARDYDRFTHLLQDGGALDGVRLVKPETAALMMSNLLPPGVTYTSVSGATGGTAGGAATMGYGAGGSVTLVDVPGGAHKGTYAWGGAAGTIFWVDPVRRFRGTVMVNYLPSDKWPIRSDVAKALRTDLARYR
ncbi:serine hydrolase [Sphingomonas sp. NFR15]|uniref:serine hydrolase domain-containing protein n=1 Tax=Sphingomonas sp. NFR15 TaxID=1566282 RepID=UPI0008805AE5|nr:serine hydrolase domain-containing protein [Sphingomonas sp. NFR15]SDA35280.1 CubicO group peptidase, beta-lactamase class C family [Sphingomonas sp. NFR15]